MTTFIAVVAFLAWSWFVLTLGFKCGITWGIDRMKQALDESGAVISRRQRD